MIKMPKKSAKFVVMSKNYKYRLLLVVFIALFCVVSISNRGIAQSITPPPISASHIYIHPITQLRLQSEGHNLSNIYTARDLEMKSGVSLDIWLAAIKLGKTWPQAINELATSRGIHLPRMPFNVAESRDLTYEEVKYFMTVGGHSANDILTAGDLAMLYGSDPGYLLRLRSGESWDSIRYGEHEKYLAKVQVEQVSMASMKFPTPGGLSNDWECSYLLKQGYKLQQVKEWDALAAQLGIDFRLVLGTKTLLQPSWQQAIIETFARILSEQGTAFDKTRGIDNHGASFIAAVPGGTVQLEVSKGSLVAVTFNGMEKTPAGLTADEITQYLDRMSLPDLLLTDYKAYFLKVDMREVVAAKTDKVSWDYALQIVARRSGRLFFSESDIVAFSARGLYRDDFMFLEQFKYHFGCVHIPSTVDSQPNLTF